MEKKKPGPKPKDPSQKKRTTTISLTPTEQQQLETLAKQRGISSSAVVAELIRKEVLYTDLDVDKTRYGTIDIPNK